MKTFSHLKMKRLALLFFCCYQMVSLAQFDQTIHIRSGSKRVSILPELTSRLLINMAEPIDSSTTIHKSFTGKVLSVNKDEIQMQISTESISCKGNQCSFRYNYITYGEDMKTMALNKNDISYIHYVSKSDERLFNSGMTLTILGIITAAVIAPLISVNYDTWQVNRGLFFTTAGAGVGLCIISIPLFISAKADWFHFKPHNYERVWEFED